MVISYEQAVFKMLRNPKITGCLELISPKTFDFYSFSL